MTKTSESHIDTPNIVFLECFSLQNDYYVNYSDNLKLKENTKVIHN